MKTLHFNTDYQYTPEDIYATTYMFYEGSLVDVEDDIADAALAAGAAIEPPAQAPTS